jgi:hypothetical protein
MACVWEIRRPSVRKYELSTSGDRERSGEAILTLVAVSRKLRNLSGYTESSLKGLARLLAAMFYEFQMINPTPLADGKWVDETMNRVVRDFLTQNKSRISPDKFVQILLG